MREVRVLLADDYEPWCRCVAALFLKHSEWRIIEEVRNGLEAVKKTQELHPDLVLMDLSLPKLGGIEAANRIRQTASATKIVFITAYQDSDAMQKVLRNEAEGYVLKWEIHRELVPAVETVLRGGKFVSARLTDSPNVRL
jgi:DNA-binding NarL/FixJ family response regulator